MKFMIKDNEINYTVNKYHWTNTQLLTTSENNRLMSCAIDSRTNWRGGNFSGNEHDWLMKNKATYQTLPKMSISNIHLYINNLNILI